MSEPRSGSRGAVLVNGSAIAEITKWSLSEKADIDEWSSSSTGGEKDCIAGALSRSGSFDFKFDFSSPQRGQLERGASVTLKLILDTDDDTAFEGPARIEEISCETTIDGGPAVTGTCSFRGRPGWTGPGDA